MPSACVACPLFTYQTQKTEDIQKLSNTRMGQSNQCVKDSPLYTNVLNPCSVEGTIAQ